MRFEYFNTASSDKIYEERIGNDVEGSSRGLILSVFAWRDWGNHQNLSQDSRSPGPEIWTPNLPDKKLEGYHSTTLCGHRTSARERLMVTTNIKYENSLWRENNLGCYFGLRATHCIPHTVCVSCIIQTLAFIVAECKRRKGGCISERLLRYKSWPILLDSIFWENFSLLWSS